MKDSHVTQQCDHLKKLLATVQEQQTVQLKLIQERWELNSSNQASLKKHHLNWRAAFRSTIPDRAKKCEPTRPRCPWKTAKPSARTRASKTRQRERGASSWIPLWTVMFCNWPGNQHELFWLFRRVRELNSSNTKKFLDERKRVSCYLFIQVYLKE